MGQPLNSDSLTQVINTQDKDTSKLNNLLILTTELRKIDPEKAFDYADQTFKLAEELNRPEEKIDVLFEYSILYKLYGELDSAKYVSLLAIQLADSIGDASRLGTNQWYCGNIIREMGETEKGFNYYKKAFKTFDRVNDSVGLAKVYNGYGIIYKIKGMLDSAAYYYQLSIRIFEQLGDIQRASASMINLGKIYLQLGDLKNARQYLDQSIVHATKFNRIRHLVIAYMNLGIVDYEEENYDQAITHYNKALEWAEQIQDKSGMANAYNNIGNIYFTQKEDYNSAYQYYNKALAIFHEMDNKSGLVVNLMNIAVIHEQRKNYNKALEINDTCLKIAKEIGDLNYQIIINNNMFSIYFNMGNSGKALAHFMEYHELNDSLFNIEQTAVVTDLTLKYEKEKDQARILSLENENLKKDLDLRARTSQRNIYLASGIGLVLILFFFIIFFRQKNRKDRIIAEQKINQLEEEKKLLAARSIVEGQEEERKRIAKELHDGLGVLLSSAKMHFTTLKVKIPENKKLFDKANKLLEQANSDVRRISHNMMPGLLTKYGLFDALEDLFEQVDETEGISAKVNFQGDRSRMNENTEIMLYRIVQEMVNNTLKHANANEISLDIAMKDGKAIFQYTDDGIGFDFEDKVRSKSMGLTSLQSRVKFLGGELDVQRLEEQGIRYRFQILI